MSRSKPHDNYCQEAQDANIVQRSVERAGAEIFTRQGKGETFMRNLRIGLMAVLCVLWAGAAWADKDDRDDKGDRAVSRPSRFGTRDK